jgi:predicted restriction endonuclease
MAAALGKESDEAERSGQFDPTSIEDARKRIRVGIVLRQGQRSFRKALMKAYRGRCAMAGCDCPDALEAAHIHPYRGDETNHVNNGLLLRADLHTLFDLGRITINPQNYNIMVAGALRKTVYGKFHGSKLHLPKDSSLRPNIEVLAKHHQMARQ